MIDLPTVLHAPAPVWTPRFDVPAAVTPIDLTEAPGVAAERLSAQARSVLPQITDEQVSRLVAAHRMVVDSLRAGGAYWAGSCLARSGVDPGLLTVAHVAASLLDVETDSVDLVAVVADLNRGTGSLASTGPEDDSSHCVADLIQLPVGPAVLAISEQVVSTAGMFSGARDRRVRQVLVALPVPDSPRLAILTMATEHLDDWAAYLDLMAVIAGSLRFTGS